MSPSQITTADPSYLFAQAVNVFEPVGYLEYYYNAPFKYAWSGMGLMSAGASESFISMTATGDQGTQFTKTLRIAHDMENQIGKNAGTEGVAVWEPYLAATNVLTVYLGIFDTDMNGDIPFKEACYAAYGGTLTPAYDSVQSLYDLWLSQLDEAITIFNKDGATMRSSQDVIYGGDMAKWAKLANSLKLRIAVRLLAQDPAKAKAIAAAVTSKPYIDDVSDDMIFNKALTGSDMDDYIYHWNNGFYGMVARQGVVDFMVNNVDPRVRFFYNKNQWNSKIVQEFWNQGKDIPPFIEKNVKFHVGADGKKVFDSWGGLGEPWVRYYGMTDDWMDSETVTMEKYKWYFPGKYPKTNEELTIVDKEGKNPAQYTSYSTLSQMMIIGRTYTSASQVSSSTTPDDTYTFTTQSRPWYGMYIGTGEVNLYLAEFAMLNNDEASAKKYYEKALRASVEEFNLLAGYNQIAYHSSVAGCFGYDENEGKIDLQDGEIDAMLASEGYAFTGTAAEKLEKIYLQELLHFTLYPNEMFVTARRSGYPSFNSTLLPRVDYAKLPVAKIPRRFPTGSPAVSDLMAPFMRAAWQSQGLTETASGNYSEVLATERLWADKGNPAWGAGK